MEIIEKLDFVEPKEKGERKFMELIDWIYTPKISRSGYSRPEKYRMTGNIKQPMQ